MMNATVSQPKSFRGKRKNIEDDNIQREEMDIRRRVHHIVLKFNPHTFPNGTFYTFCKYLYRQRINTRQCFNHYLRLNI